MTARVSKRNVLVVAQGMLLLAVSGVHAGFPAPITANPSSQLTATIPSLSDGQSISYTRQLRFDNDLTTNYPSVYWFKYTSDGNPNVQVKFDTLGSDFSSQGPGVTTAPGSGVLPNVGETQIAVYKTDGTKVAISRGTRDLNGNLIPVSVYSANPADSYKAQGLSELYFQPNAPTNPKWNVDPNAPRNYTSFGGQRYYQNPGWGVPGSGVTRPTEGGYYYTNLNEYDVWNLALDDDPTKVNYVRDYLGRPVTRLGEVIDTSQTGWEANAVKHDGSLFWRNSDHYNTGPGSTWNRYESLEAGEYYIAVSSVTPVFAGDTSLEEYLQHKIHYDPATPGTPQAKLAGPLGPFQYYEQEGSTPYFGTITLNVTQTLVPEPIIVAPAAMALMTFMRRRR